MVKKRIVLKNRRPVETTVESSQESVDDHEPLPDRSKPDIELNDLIKEIRIQNDYLNKIDWKLWKLMNMVAIVCEENGYVITETRK